MHQDEIANIAANLESGFKHYSDPFYKSPLAPPITVQYEVPGMEGVQTHHLKVLAIHQLESDKILYENGEAVTVSGPKAIALTDEAGNIYVHFNGTGDGKWGYNSQAYDGKPSVVQEQALEFFNTVIAEHYEGSGTGNVYVSGHSQGGNTAQYVTINSQYGDYIDTCITMDGPGFSEGIVHDAIDQYGEAYFNRQTDKIYAYNGESDFVSPLGQVHIIPEGHTTVVATPSFEQNHNLFDAHDISGMLTKDGELSSLNLPPEGQEYHDTPFREFIKSFAAEITTLPQEDQAHAAELAMKFAEYYLGNGSGGNQQPVLTQQDLDEFTELLAPLLVSYLEKNPNMLAPALEYLGFSPDTAALIDSFIKNFNDLPEEQRKAALMALLGCLVITEDGGIGLDLDLQNIIVALGTLLPTIIEAAESQGPAGVYAVLKEFGVIDMVINFVEEHPFAAFAITVIGILMLDTIVNIIKIVEAITYIVEAFYTIVEKLSELAEEIKKFILDTLESIKEIIGQIKEYLRKNSPGGKYVRDNPYFSADPALLRDYARRLSNINSRLVSLDHDLNDLYWQVGLLDIWDILQANIITSYSVNVRLAQGYLNSAADKIEAADNKALQYMGG
ncbi:MAG: DUF2974 domain-containing protein [Firmicutes bacterium]|nr:DUF2974 domain-containing protein [Bacillota bacterium]